MSLWASHPPLAWWPASLVAVPLLLAGLLVRPSRAVAGTLGLGVVAGLAAYGPMLWWLVLPAGVVAWALLVAVQAAWLGLTSLVLAAAVQRWWIVVVAPAAWVAMDAWRGVVPLGGFEWGAIAYAHAGDRWLLPLARLLGARGITLAVVLLGVLAFEAGRRLWQEGGSPGRRLRAAAPAVLGLAVTAALAGVVRVAPPAPSGRSLDVLAVQGNDLGPRPPPGVDEDRVIARRMLAETRRAVAGGPAPEVTVWPESSIDRDPYASPEGQLRGVLSAAAGLVGGRLIVGMNLHGPRPGTRRNAAVHVDEEGRPVDRYVKRRLVPFGEYVPLRGLLGGLPPLEQQVPVDAVPGAGPHSLQLDGARLAPAICYETLFPGLVRGNVLAAEQPAGLILATTNDASYGRSAEPAQHLAQSRLRAVETGRWVVHAALSGSSAFVDPDGRVHQPTELFTVSSIRRSLPLVTAPTPFLSLGDVLGAVARVAGVGLLAWALLGAWRRRRRRP